jgi:hypothetical protein
MAKELKVYGWTGSRNAARAGNSVHSQTREFMAAYSVAEVLRATGMPRSSWHFSGAETGNDREVEVAMANPGKVFWMKLDHKSDSPIFNNDNTPYIPEVKYPENEKRSQLMPTIDALHEFLENLGSMNLVLCDADGDGFGRLFPTSRTLDQLINQHLGIDARKLEQERRAMLEQYK